jgi:hypothetical protein
LYSTCLFCSTDVGRNEIIEHFPVGRRLAFDAAKGRLWAICPHCDRWNLSPLDERWEAIEQCERVFRATRLRVSTDNIGLAKLTEGLELVRIGAPMRPEFAAWRYGPRFGHRRRRAQIVAGTGVAATVLASVALGPTLAPALTLGAISIIVIPGITTVMGVIPMVGVLAARDYMQHERVVARIAQPVDDATPHRPLSIRARHVLSADLRVADDGATATLDVPHDNGWAHFEGTPAIHTASVLLAGANRFGASERQVSDAVARIDQHGDSTAYLAATSNLGSSRGKIMSMLNIYRGLGALHLAPAERLALEMAMHEETERRALEGELEVLAEAWREAEEIAEIADGL